MNRSGWRSHLTALLTALIACVGLLSLSTAPAWAAAGTITEFSIPPAESDPVGITAGPDGNLWFTDSASAIGRITTKGHVTGFPIPTANSGLFGITAGSDGNLWFTEETSNKIGRITTAGLVTEFPLPTTCGSSSGCQPLGITAGPDGNLWFTEASGNKIGRITTAGLVTEFLSGVGIEGNKRARKKGGGKEHENISCDDDTSINFFKKVSED